MRGRIVILSGDRGSGKTTTCRKLVEVIRQRGLDCAGVICPARFDGDRKVGIDLLDLRSGQTRPLAEADDRPAALRTRAWRFDEAVMDWGKECLEAALPCDVFMVDELGPLELERGQGWTNAIGSLREGRFDLAVVVIRPELVDVFRSALNGMTIPVFIVSSPQSGGECVVSILTLL